MASQMKRCILYGTLTLDVSTARQSDAPKALGVGERGAPDGQQPELRARRQQPHGLPPRHRRARAAREVHARHARQRHRVQPRRACARIRRQRWHRTRAAVAHARCVRRHRKGLGDDGALSAYLLSSSSADTVTNRTRLAFSS